MGRYAAECLDRAFYVLEKSTQKSGVSSVDVKNAMRSIAEACAHVDRDAETSDLEASCQTAMSEYLNTRCYSMDILALTRPVDAAMLRAASAALTALREKLEALPADQATKNLGCE